MSTATATPRVELHRARGENLVLVIDGVKTAFTGFEDDGSVVLIDEKGERADLSLRAFGELLSQLPE